MGKLVKREKIFYVIYIYEISVLNAKFSFQNFLFSSKTMFLQLYIKEKCHIFRSLRVSIAVLNQVKKPLQPPLNVTRTVGRRNG